MGKDIVQYKFRPKRGGLLVVAYERSDRGTRYPVGSTFVFLAGKPREERQGVIEQAIGQLSRESQGL